MIQFDEPCFNVYVDKVKDWGMAALERGPEDQVTKAVHICYGYGTADVKRWKSANTDWSHYEDTLPLLANSTIDQVSIETAASGVDVRSSGRCVARTYCWASSISEMKRSKPPKRSPVGCARRCDTSSRAICSPAPIAE